MTPFTKSQIVLTVLWMKLTKPHTLAMFRLSPI